MLLQLNMSEVLVQERVFVVRLMWVTLLMTKAKMALPTLCCALEILTKYIERLPLLEEMCIFVQEQFFSSPPCYIGGI